MTCILPILFINFQEDNLLWYCSSTFTLFFLDILIQVLVKIYALFVLHWKKNNLSFGRELCEWNLDFLFLKHGHISTYGPNTNTYIDFFRTNFILPLFIRKGSGDKNVELTMFLKYHYPTKHTFQVLVLLKRERKCMI